jgi:microcystin-dependent protein
MAQPHIGEIRMFGGNFPPVGWMFCDGKLLPISENKTAFQLIGTTAAWTSQTVPVTKSASRRPLVRLPHQ